MTKYVLPPGASLREILDFRGMTQNDLAVRIGRPYEQVSRLMGGHIRLTERWALELERATKINARAWLVMEVDYRLFLARQKLRDG